jgi:branched-chain amino acid transport system substrate-binding protein
MARSITHLLAAVVLTALNPTLARADIMVATAGPMSGQYAWFGEQMP